MFRTGPILLGQYRPLDSFLHRLDARAKLVPVVLVLVLALLTNSIAFYLAILAALLLGLLFSGVGVDALVRSLTPVVILVAITFLYHLIFTERDSRAVTSIFGWAITEGGLRAGGFYSLRLLLFVSMAFLVTLTNSPTELAEALAKMLGPLRRFKVPVNDVVMIIFIALRFIPILYDEFVAIRNAQIMRGVDFTGSFFSRVKKTVYLLIPVFVAAVSRADDLALALEARGYKSRAERTFYSHARLGLAEYSFMAAATVGIVALYVVTL